MPPEVRCERCAVCDDVTPHSGRRLTVWWALSIGLALGGTVAWWDGSRWIAGLAAFLALAGWFLHCQTLARIDCERCRGREWASRRRRSVFGDPRRTIVDPL